MLLKLKEPHFFSPHNVANNKHIYSLCLFALEVLSSIFTGYAIYLFFIGQNLKYKASRSYFPL